MNQPWDIAIVGGGVIGLSAAVHLLEKKPDLKVIIFDSPNRPGIASRAAAGMLPPYAEFSESDFTFRKSQESYRYYPEFLEKFTNSHAGKIDLEMNGVLLPGGGEQENRSRRHAEFAAIHGEVEELSPEDLREIEPSLSGEVWQRAWLVPGGIIDPGKLHDALKSEVIRRGAEFRESIIKTLLRQNELWHLTVQDEPAPVQAESVLIASGAWTPELTRLTGLNLDLEPIKGQVAKVNPGSRMLKHVIHASGIYLAPRPNGDIIIGATMELAGYDTSTEPDVIEDLKVQATRLAPFLAELPIQSSWAGLRPKLTDSMPAIGWIPQKSRLMIATGHFRNGILLTPITGKIAAECYFTESNFPAGDFSPERLDL